MTVSTVRLSDFCEIVSGATPRRDHPEYWNGDIAWVTPKDIRNLEGAVLMDTPEHITKEGYESCSARLLPVGSVLFSSRAPIGLVAITGREMCTNQGFKSLVPGPDVHAGYLYWCMKREAPRIAAKSSGTTFSEISRKGMERVQIPLPPLPKQRRIAAILDKADAVRCKRQQTLDLADQFLRSAFLDLFGDPVTNPKGWPVVKFGDLLADISYGTSKKCVAERGAGMTLILRIPNVLGGAITSDDAKYCVLDERELTKLRLDDGDLLFVRTNGNPEYIARCAVFGAGDEPTAFASYLIRARLRKGADALPAFLREQVSFPTYRSRLIRETRTTAGNYNISSKGLRRLRLILPPMSEQVRFLHAVEAISQLQHRYATVQTNEDALFAALTQRAFRGRL